VVEILLLSSIAHANQGKQKEHNEKKSSTEMTACVGNTQV
jgi:hypothetical protein